MGRVARIRGVHRPVQEAAGRRRAAMTPAERSLWAALSGRQLGGLRFRRQHPLGPFVLDFCCPARGLVVELDGAGHDDPEQAGRDAARSARLRDHGYRVLRFRNEEVLADRPRVLDAIAAAAGLPPPRE